MSERPEHIDFGFAASVRALASARANGDKKSTDRVHSKKKPGHKEGTAPLDTRAPDVPALSTPKPKPKLKSKPKPAGGERSGSGDAAPKGDGAGHRSVSAGKPPKPSPKPKLARKAAATPASARATKARDASPRPASTKDAPHASPSAPKRSSPPALDAAAVATIVRDALRADIEATLAAYTVALDAKYAPPAPKKRVVKKKTKKPLVPPPLPVIRTPWSWLSDVDDERETAFSPVIRRYTSAHVPGARVSPKAVTLIDACITYVLATLSALALTYTQSAGRKKVSKADLQAAMRVVCPASVLAELAAGMYSSDPDLVPAAPLSPP